MSAKKDNRVTCTDALSEELNIRINELKITITHPCQIYPIIDLARLSMSTCLDVEARLNKLSSLSAHDVIPSFIIGDETHLIVNKLMEMAFSPCWVSAKNPLESLPTSSSQRTEKSVQACEDGVNQHVSQIFSQGEAASDQTVKREVLSTPDSQSVNLGSSKSYSQIPSSKNAKTIAMKHSVRQSSSGLTRTKIVLGLYSLLAAISICIIAIFVASPSIVNPYAPVEKIPEDEQR